MLQLYQKIALSTCVILGATYLYLYLYLFVAKHTDTDTDSDSTANSTSTSSDYDCSSGSGSGSHSFFSRHKAECELIRLAASVKWLNPEMYDALISKHPVSTSTQYCARPDKYIYGYQYRDCGILHSRKKTKTKTKTKTKGEGEGEGEEGGEEEGVKANTLIEDFDIGDIGGEIRRAFEAPIRPIQEFVERITNAFNKIPERVQNFDRAFKLVGEGVEKEFINLGKTLDLGARDVFNLVGAAGECGLKFVTNLRGCAMWYIMDGLGATVYAIFVELPLFVVQQIFDLDLHSYVRDLKDALREMDDEIFNLTSYHVIHFPEDVIRDCYTCDISGQVNKLKSDFETVIPELMNEPNKIFQDASTEFKAVFAPF
jgi:hypothetical protein